LRVELLAAEDVRIDEGNVPSCDGLSFRSKGRRLLVLGAPRALTLATMGVLPVVRGRLLVQGRDASTAVKEGRLAGAAVAIRKDKSLLSIGVAGLRGDFRVGDAVRVLAPDGSEIGRGLARLSAADAVRVAGRKDAREEEAVLVHRDELVVW